MTRSLSCAADAGNSQPVAVNETLTSLPSELLWLVLSYSSLVDLPALNRACCSLRCALCELLHPPRVERCSSHYSPTSSSPRSSCLPLPCSVLPPLTSSFLHARPLLAFLSVDDPTLLQLLISRQRRTEAAQRFASPPPLVRRLLRRFPALMPSFRRKQSRLTERRQLADSLLQLTAIAPVIIAVAAARSVLPAKLRLPALFPLPLPLLSRDGALRCRTAACLLLCSVAALTTCDAQLAIHQRASAETSALTTARSNTEEGAAIVSRHSEEDGSDGVSDDDSEPEERMMDDHDDDDVAFQRRMLRSAEAVLRRRARRRRRGRVAPGAVDDHSTARSAVWRAPTAIALAHARSSLQREEGSSLRIRLVAAIVSAVRSELLYRHLLIEAVFASLSALLLLCRRVALLDGLRLLVDGLVPAIPLLAVAHSVLTGLDLAPASLARVVERLRHPRVIVTMRLVGFAATLAANGAFYRPLLLLLDRLALPLMDSLTPAPWRPHGPLTDGSTRPPLGQLSVLRLFALALFVSQLTSFADRRCVEICARRLSRNSVAGDVDLSGAVQRCCLSVGLLRVRLSGGLLCSTAVHALLNCTAVLTRQWALS